MSAGNEVIHTAKINTTIGLLLGLSLCLRYDHFLHLIVRQTYIFQKQISVSISVSFEYKILPKKYFL